MLGLSEKAGLEIPGEQPGVLPAEPPKNGGVGMMTSFGEGITVTPLELAALLSAIANGGTLYYLQYPRTQAEIDQFAPKVKRPLELAPNGITDIRPGMRAAVDYGTARRAGYDPSEPILGKTGTCTDFRLASHMGWFGSFNDVGHHQLVIVVMLAGSRSFSGSVAGGGGGTHLPHPPRPALLPRRSGTEARLPGDHQPQPLLLAIGAGIHAPRYF